MFLFIPNSKNQDTLQQNLKKQNKKSGKTQFSNNTLYGGNSNIHKKSTSKMRKNIFKPHAPWPALLGES